MKHPTLIFALAASIAALIPHSIIEPAYGAEIGGTIDPASVQEFAAKDLNRIRGNVVRCLTRKSPYVDILDGGTIESGVSDVQRVIVQERASIGQSLVEPTFTLDVNIGGKTGDEAKVGSTEYSYQLATNRGKGPLVGIKGAWSAFKGSYSAAEDSLKKQIVQLNNADVRITLVKRSGCKVMLKAGESFSNMFDGDIQRIDTPFTTAVGLPNAQPNMKFLQYLGRFLREDFLVEPWEGKSGDMILKLIGSQELIDNLRDDAGVREDHRYIAAGSYEVGKMTLTRYVWEGPYRGWGFGVDPQPLRFNTVDGSGQPVYIEPEIEVETDKGVGSRPNPAWIRAKYEIALVLGQNSFQKLTPDSYTGEGSFKFPNQTVSGEMKWLNLQDNDKNVWQDFGRHYYQFSRAYKPIRPHAVTAIAIARQQIDFGLTSITSFGDWSSTGSI